MAFTFSKSLFEKEHELMLNIKITTNRKATIFLI